MSIFDNLGVTEEQLKDTDISFPILKPNIYAFSVKSMEDKVSERTGGEYVEIQLTLAQDAEDTGGNPVSPGYPLRHMITSVPTEKFPAERCAQELAKFLDAVATSFNGDGSPVREVDSTYQIFIGRTLNVKTKIQAKRTNDETGEEYPEATGIASLVPASN